MQSNINSCNASIFAIVNTYYRFYFKKTTFYSSLCVLCYSNSIDTNEYDYIFKHIVFITKHLHTLGQTCDFWCTSCSGGTCNSCIDGYYPSGKGCYHCSYAGCHTCSDNSSCDTCIDSYFLNDNLCSRCASNFCHKCSDSSSCETCMPGF